MNCGVDTWMASCTLPDPRGSKKSKEAFPARFPQRNARIAARHATSEYGATAGAVRGVARARVPVPLPENATGKNGGRRARSH